MSLFFCLCIVYIQVINTSSTQNAKKPVIYPVKETEVIFASVIKNITRVNNVLQDLINNYKRLQKIYKSQENTESITSDDEIDEVFKSKKKSKFEETTVKTHDFAATQILWEESDDKIRESTVSEEVEVSDDKSNTKEAHVGPKPANVIFDTHKITKEVNETENPISISKQDTPKVSSKPPRSTKENLVLGGLSQGKEESSNSQELGRNINKQALRNVETEKNDTRISGTKKKVKFNVPDILRDNIPNVEKKLYSETFSAKKIWDEIISNKPINLQVHSQYLESIRKSRVKNSHLIGRQGNTALVIVTGNKAINKTKEIIDSASELIDGNTGAVKGELRDTELRQSYGDACMKLVIKKCYKALNSVKKSMCMRYRCKSAYKEKFLSYSKRGCINEFIGNDSVVYDKHFYRDNTAQNIESKDLTRIGYMQACLPQIASELKAMQESQDPVKIAPNDTSSINPVMLNFNVLRDRFEKACKKISTRKCIEACNYATTKICSEFICPRSKRSAYKKSCKRECKNVYQLYLGSRTSTSDSGFDSSDSSDSDSSDSDSSD